MGGRVPRTSHLTTTTPSLVKPQTTESQADLLGPSRILRALSLFTRSLSGATQLWTPEVNRFEFLLSSLSSWVTTASYATSLSLSCSRWRTQVKVPVVVTIQPCHLRVLVPRLYERRQEKVFLRRRGGC